MHPCAGLWRTVLSTRVAHAQLPKARPLVYVHARSDAAAKAALASVLEVGALAGAEAVTVVRDEAGVPPGCALEIVSDAVSVYMNLKGAVDAKAEIDKLQKKLAQLSKSAEALQKQAAAADYEVKVPAQVRADNLAKLAKLAAESEAAEKGVADFTAMLA
jgi:valyl-tRNA synthetase